MNYVKYMPHNSLRSASRNRREMSAAQEFGFDIFAFSDDRSLEGIDLPESITLVCDQKSVLTPAIPRLIRAWLLIVSQIRMFFLSTKLPDGVWSCHDLPALLMAYLSTMFRRQRVKLIYDSHEFEIGRNVSRNKLQIWWITHLEQYLMNRCAFSIMVNDVIADEVQRVHGLQQRPIVVRSTPNKWDVDQQVCVEIRQSFRDQLGGQERFLLMYHGGYQSGRGIETLIELVRINPNVAAVILGYGQESYVQSLHALVEEKGVSDRILFHDAVPLRELWKYVGAADVGMVTVQPVAKSYYYMLPNKFLENIQSETPIICSDFPVVGQLVKKYEIGLTCDPCDVDDINTQVEKMRTDSAFHRNCKENLKKAKEDLCWENEKQVLFDAYRNYL